MDFKKLLFFLLGLTAIVFIVLASSKSKTIQTDKISAVASFYPLYDFAKNVGGDKVEVTNITPAGAEPHDFEPSPQDLVKIQKADVFVYNGAGFEPWVQKVNTKLAVNTSESIDILEGDEEDEPFDPHIWLNPNLAMTQVDNISKALIKADLLNKIYYENNAKNYKQKLSSLDQEFAKALKSCISRTIVTSHSAFNYLAKRYNLEVVTISGISPDEEPSLKAMTEIVKIAKKHNVKYIFFETLVSSKLSETIAKEIGAQTLVFNPVEGLTDDELNQGLDYISIQRANLQNLKLALQCK